MAVTPEGNVAYLRGVLELAEQGAQGVATDMARYITWRVKNITLRRTYHSPGEWYRARPGEPPAYASGTLADSIYFRPAYPGLRASALVQVDPDLPYGRILEFGCVVSPTYYSLMHWKDTGGSWYHPVLTVEAHPYLGPTTEEAIDDGSLEEVAIEAFREFDP
jgi:hypothetical protein